MGSQVMTSHITGVGEVIPFQLVSSCDHCIKFGGQCGIGGESKERTEVVIYFFELVLLFFVDLFGLDFFVPVLFRFEALEESLPDSSVDSFLFGGELFLFDFFFNGARLGCAPRELFFDGCWLLLRVIRWPSLSMSVRIFLTCVATSFWMRFFTVAGSAAPSVSSSIAVASVLLPTANSLSWTSILLMAVLVLSSVMWVSQLFTKISSSSGCNSVDTFAKGVARF